MARADRDIPDRSANSDGQLERIPTHHFCDGHGGADERGRQRAAAGCSCYGQLLLEYDRARGAVWSQQRYANLMPAGGRQRPKQADFRIYLSHSKFRFEILVALTFQNVMQGVVGHPCAARNNNCTGGIRSLGDSWGLF